MSGLDPFVPALVHRHLARYPDGTNPVLDAGRTVIDEMSAAVLVADISGFTQLAEQLEREGVAGAEELQGILNLCFGRLVELVTEHGGDVVKFAGDAAIAVWPDDGELEVAVRRAVSCGIAVQTTFGQLVTENETPLHLRVSVGAGRLVAAHLGGVEGRCELLVAGDALEQLEQLESAADEVVLAPTAWSLVAGACDGSPTGTGAYRVRRAPAATLSALGPPPVGSPGVCAYVPRSVRARLEAGQGEWLAEFRKVTVAFVNVRGLDYRTDAGRARLQPLIEDLQRAIYRYEGSVNQLVVDDKGTILVAGWGLALHAHEDDAVRGLMAMDEVREAVRRLELASGIGIATGQVFTGLRGHPERREFAMIGDKVNLAARLMQAAGDRILCDQLTQAEARARWLFEALPPIRLKGKARSVAVFRPVAKKPREGLDPRGLVGRGQELGVLLEELQALAGGGDGGIVVVEGEPGIGKSQLTAAFMERAGQRSMATYVVMGDAFGQAMAYHAWRGVFHRLLDLESLSDAAGRDERVLSVLERHERPLAALLNPILSVELPETEATRPLTAEGRAERTHDLLSNLFRRLHGDAPAILVLEDAHWLDSRSWALAATFKERVPSLLVLIVSRVVAEEEQSQEARRLLRQGRCLRLEALARADALALVCRCLGVDSVPHEVAVRILATTEGHPFYVEELARSLRDRGLLAIENGECRLIEDGSSLKTVDFPDSVQAVITSRIDLLTPPQQLTLKVASVLGQTFELAALRRVYPIAADLPLLDDHLAAIAQRDLIQAGASAVRSTFKHALVREVAYQMLPYAQRRQLHRGAAEWWEAEAPDDPSSYAQLAHHWSSADDAERATHYLEKAGHQAMRELANREAAEFFRQALELVDGTSDGASREGPWEIRRTRWLRRLGEAYWRMGDNPRAAEVFAATLARVGYRLPRGRIATVRFLVPQVLREVLRQLGLPLSLPLSEERRSQMQEAAGAAGLLAWISGHKLDSTGVVTASLLAVNLAATARTTNHYGLAFVGQIASSLKLRRVAERCFERGLRTADELGDQSPLVFLLIQYSSVLMAAGDMALSERMQARGLELAEKIGDRLGRAHVRLIMGARLSCTGDFAGQLECSLASRAEFESIAEQPAAAGLGVWYELGVLCARAYLDRPEDVCARLEDYGAAILRLQASDEETGSLIVVTSLRAAVCARMDDLESARAAADQTVAYLERCGYAVNPACWQSFDGPLDAYLACWDRARETGDPEARQLERRTRKLLKAMRRWTATFPFRQGRTFFYQGEIAWRSARPERAVALWRRSLRQARAVGLDFDAAMAHLALGRTAAAGSARRDEHLTEAARLFSRCRTCYYVDLVDSLK